MPKRPSRATVPRPRARTGIRPQRSADRDRRPRSSRKGVRRGPIDFPRTGRRSPFDAFAERITVVSASAYFFAVCAGAILAWGVFGPITGYSETWQLVINTATTIVTFLMVALLQNSQRRAEKAMNHKLDAIADALADFMDKADIELDRDVQELEQAIGLEEREGSG